MSSLFLWRWVKPFPLLLLVAIYPLFVYAAKLGLAIDSAQTFLFPLIALLFACLPASARLPKFWVFLSLLGWAGSALHIRGYLPALNSAPTVYLGTLEKDPTGEAGRDLLRRYNVIAEAYGLPPMQILARSFQDLPLAARWADKHANAQAVISGTPEWLNVIFPSQIFANTSLIKSGESAAPPAATELLKAEAARLKIPLTDKLRLVQIPGIGSPLVISLAPDAVHVPGEPTELARHYIGWLARGVGAVHEEYKTIGDGRLWTGQRPAFSRAQLSEYRADALSQLTMMLGSWKSPEPIAVGRFLLGTQEFLTLLEEGALNQQGLLAAMDHYHQAQRILRPKYDGELMALIRNNYAVLCLLDDSSDAERFKIRKELWNAVSVQDSSGEPPFGARLAMLNSILLDSEGEL